MRLFAKELAVGTLANECFGIYQRHMIETPCRLVCEKPRGSRTCLSESLAVELEQFEEG
jgi:hypothetical protein